MTVSLENTGGVLPQFIIIAAENSGNNTIIDAVPSKKLKIFSLFMSADNKVTAEFQDGADGTPLMGAIDMIKSSIVPLSFNPFGHMETSKNTLFNLNLSNMGENPACVNGCLVYAEI